MDAKNWDHLLDSLEENKCILCLGPEVYSSTDKGRLETQLANFLQKESEAIRIRVYEDGWFHYLPNASEIDAWQRVKEFYRQSNDRSEKMLQKIAQIPCHFILNFTPDYKLKVAFEQQDFAFNFLSYLKKQPFDPQEEANRYTPTKLKPLIYNMVGEIRKRNSLVMTYNDFYAYLESIFEGNSMAPVLKENIWEADYFIFLGMPFDRWYVHMFMRILQQHERNRASKKYAANIYLSDEITTHCAEQYTMTFVPNGIENFVDTFYEKCKTRGFLRTAAQAAKLQLPIDQLKSWVAENQFQEIFDQLIVQLSEIGPAGEEWKNQVFQLEGRYNDLRRNIRMGTIDERDRMVETNRLRAVIMDLIQDLQNQFN
ncbi:SIR2 family protein [Flavilitoribacter nigricans]|nr:SIR2 family protein [Flavilitoribacter nigricans]